MDVYIDSGSITGTSPNQLEFKLQDVTTNSGAPWDNQSSIIQAVDQLDTWVSLEFDFSTKTDGTWTVPILIILYYNLTVRLIMML